MTDIVNFDIVSAGAISKYFLANDILTYSEATKFIRQLPYGRNKNKTDLATVFLDNCGTCSTKHALLKLLAVENNFTNLRLMIGLFRMNSKNTPNVSSTLKRYHLVYISEAHNYLRYKGQILDYTNMSSKPDDFKNDLIEEMEIQPYQISDFKINYHKKYLSYWLEKQEGLNLTLDVLWSIREQCIFDLSTS